ncbi:nitrate- and nitrite sensing domain-containing protein [Alteromonadaceae bacterium BrNp21-10]|nr:nitrate- and nitrite sensing domain-containing protein [Alteromonadaceae bacterium BrNp21-10]
MDLLTLWPIALGLTAVLALFAFVNHRLYKKNKILRYHLGLERLSLFRHLLAAMQQHRGLCNGYLNGDTSLLKRIESLQRNIDQHIKLILDCETDAAWIRNNELWMGIEDHWGRLSVHFKHGDSSSNLNQHNSIISDLLYLIEECAENHQLQELAINPNLPAAFLWQQLLYSAEYIGQARAIGTGIAAAGMSTSVQRIKLNFLQTRIQELLNTSELQSVEGDINKLIKAINQHILLDKPDVAADEYFNLATHTLNQVLERFDYFVRQLVDGVGKGGL